MSREVLLEACFESSTTKTGFNYNNQTSIYIIVSPNQWFLIQLYASDLQF